jgi:hypothetical protein
MKKVLVTVMIGLLVFGFVGLAKAEIFVNFDDPSFGYGDVDPTYDVSPTESIQFYGEITNQFDFNDGNDYVDTADHTSGFDNFLWDSYEVDADFDFGVDGFEFWWLAPEGESVYGEAWGYDGAYYGESELLIGTGSWQLIQAQANDFPGQVYSISFYNDDDTGIAVDDLRLFSSNDTVIPEPASMSLLGLGLLGLVRRYRRK